MLGIRSSLEFVLLAGSVAFAVANPAHAVQHTVSHKHAVKPAPVAAPTPGPLVPLTLEQTPATPPQVTFRDGALTIDAKNSTLGDVLRAVHAQTKAAIDAPANTSDRIVGHFGPGPAREVLADVLNGSRFNYVILGTATDPDAVQRLVLTPKPPSISEPVAQTQAIAPQPEPYGRVRRQDNASETQMSDNQSDDYNDAADDAQGGNQAGPADEQAADGTNQPPVKTPEQLLQELQRQQIQQQQGAPQDTPVQSPRQQR